jgi:restriction system protein
MLDSFGGEAKPKDVYDPLAECFQQLTPADLAVRMESTGGPKWWNLVQWVRQRLVEKGEIDGSVRGVWRITEAGRSRLANTAAGRTPNSTDSSSLVGVSAPPAYATQAPGEVIEVAHRQLRDALASELLQIVLSCSPSFFEQLVVDLLVKMGYGGTRKDAGEALGQVGDGGIDGIIKEDRLGLGVIYLQAKRWTDTVVGRPDVQKFVGSLQMHHAQKGVFITTSTFSRDALDYADRIGEPKIVLIDGTMLTRLMIDFGVGVNSVASYEIKRVDSDYFSEE